MRWLLTLLGVCLTILASCTQHAPLAPPEQGHTAVPAVEQDPARAEVETSTAHADHPASDAGGHRDAEGRPAEQQHKHHSGGHAEHPPAPAHGKGNHAEGHAAADKQHEHGQARQKEPHGKKPAEGHAHPANRRDDRVATPPAEAESEASPAADALENLSAEDVFNRRILPIAQSDKASSCTECHFGGVELKNYIREDQAATFAALRDEGLIDVQNPQRSKILQFISRQTDQTNPLLAKVRQAEQQAFGAWIQAAVRDPKLLAAKSTVKVGSELPAEVIRHMRRDRVLESFVENIWSEVGRCINCHSPERNERLVKKHGEQMSWIRPRDPAGTLAQCVEQGIIDTDAPEESLILQKPLVLIEHGGGPKFALGSRTDKNFRRFLNDYAAVVNAKYRRQDQLPQPTAQVAALTGQHLRIVDVPKQFDKKLLKVDLYRWTGDGWSDTPWGTAEGPINGAKNTWQSMVFSVADRGSPRGREFGQAQQVQLPAGRYQVKIYIDQQDRVKADRDYELSAAELYAKVEVDGDWPPGYQPPKIVAAPAQ